MGGAGRYILDAFVPFLRLLPKKKRGKRKGGRGEKGERGEGRKEMGRVKRTSYSFVAASGARTAAIVLSAGIEASARLTRTLFLFICGEGGKRGREGREEGKKGGKKGEGKVLRGLERELSDEAHSVTGGCGILSSNCPLLSR